MHDRYITYNNVKLTNIQIGGFYRKMHSQSKTANVIFVPIGFAVWSVFQIRNVRIHRHRPMTIRNTF